MVLNDLSSRLSDRDRRTLVAGTISLIGLLVLAKGAPAWHAWCQDTTANAAALIADAARSDAATAAHHTVLDSLHARTVRLRSLDSSVLAGNDPAASAAVLATLVADAATDAGVRIGAVQPHVDSEPYSLGVTRTAPARLFVTVSVRGDATGDVVALTQFIADIEHGPALLRIRGLSITQSEPAAPSTKMETLHAQFTVVGLARRAVTAREQRDSTTRPVATPSSSVLPGISTARDRQ